MIWIEMEKRITTLLEWSSAHFFPQTQWNLWLKISLENPFFFVDFEKDRMFYVAASKPIFYAYDFDEDGHFDLMFKDPLEDGINGNEEYYDRPSENVS